MKVSVHILFSIGLFLVLLPFFKLFALIPLISSILIDIDHYFYYASTRKEVNIRNTYSFFMQLRQRRDEKKQTNKILYFLAPFHTIEFIVLILILSLFSEIFALIALGIIFHLIIDGIESMTVKKHIALKSKTIYHYFNTKKEDRL